MIYTTLFSNNSCCALSSSLATVYESVEEAVRHLAGDWPSIKLQVANLAILAGNDDVRIVVSTTNLTKE